MKTKMILVLFALMMGAGCASEKKMLNGDGTAVPVVPLAPPGFPTISTTPSPTWGYGDTVEFKPVSLDVLNKYVADRSLNNPSNFRIGVNLTQTETGYSGAFKLSYNDNGALHDGEFRTGNGKDATAGVNTDIYNHWFGGGGAKFHAFFEDQYGATVLVIDSIKEVDFGDGGGRVVKGSGTVWFKNFEVSRAPKPSTKCWFIELGPYDCRTFLQNGSINTVSAVNPSTSDGYQKLGTFKELDIGKAFNRNE